MFDFTKSRSTALVATLAAAALLASCGGNDSPAGSQLGGVAATGAPMGAATITVTCASGPVQTSTTSATGTWSVNLPAGTNVPCMVKAVGGTPPVTLYSLAQSTGSVNVTPLTNLVVAAAAGANPDAWVTANSGSLSTKLAELAAKVPAAKTAVTTSLTNAGYTMPSGDFMTAAFEPKLGDPLDDLLEAVAKGLEDSGTSYATLVTQIAAAGTTPVVIPKSDVITAAQIAAQPRLNGGKISVATDSAKGAVAHLETVAQANAAGAYFGNGTGNKSVLQIPGLNGMKLKDLTSIEVEFKPNSIVSATASPIPPYLYINMVVDTQCGSPALPATATAAEARQRYRIVIYDPFYKWVQDMPTAPLFVQGQWAKLVVTPATGGWRISAGPGNNLNKGQPQATSDAGVEEVTHGSAFTLTGFKHDVYPNTCIVDNAAPADNGLFRDPAAGCGTGDISTITDDGSTNLPLTTKANCSRPVAGMLLNLGDSGVQAPASYYVKSVKVNSRIFTFE